MVAIMVTVRLVDPWQLLLRLLARACAEQLTNIFFPLSQL